MIRTQAIEMALLNKKIQKASAEELREYFHDTSVDLLTGAPEANFLCLSPKQCAGYLLFLSEGDECEERRAYLTACGMKAASKSDTYRHWKEVVSILKGVQTP